MRQVNIHYAKTHLSKLIQESMGGEEIIIAKNNKPVVKLTKITEAKHQRKFGSAKGQIEIAEDFDEPLDDFQEYMK